MKSQYVPVGSDVQFVCNAKYADQVEFYMNGAKVRPGMYDVIAVCQMQPISFLDLKLSRFVSPSKILRIVADESCDCEYVDSRAGCCVKCNR